MTAEQIRDDLLYPCWRGIADGYKQKYARNIWPQFEDNIRSAAYTSSLAKFLESLVRKLNIEFRAEDVPRINQIFAAGEDRNILAMLRNETTMLVLLVRLKNDERRERIETEKAQNADL
jgi:hypothetical protein